MTELFIRALLMLFIVQLLRAFPFPARWLERKPLSCDACMTWWTGLSCWVVEGTSSTRVCAASAGLTLLLLAVHGWLAPKLPSMPLGLGEFWPKQLHTDEPKAPPSSGPQT